MEFTYQVPNVATQLAYRVSGIWCPLKLGSNFSLASTHGVCQLYGWIWFKDLGSNDILVQWQRSYTIYIYNGWHARKLHFLISGTPFSLNKVSNVTHEIMLAHLSEYKCNIGWRLIKIPKQFHDSCWAITQIRDTTIIKSTHQIIGKFVKWVHNPQPIDWARNLFTRVRGW